MTFGPHDTFRLEAGPTIGAQIIRLKSKGRVRTFDTTGATTNIDEEFSEASGETTFNYGLGLTLSCKIDKNWSARIGYRHIQSTRAEFHQEIDPLTETAGGTTRSVYHQAIIPAHGINFLSLGVEYTF